MVNKAAKKTQAAVAEPRGYHHGDLPETLMDAAVRHVAAEGTEKLSLRALARECGVSATAPYRHFPSKRCLLAAIATRGFMQLRSHCEAHLDRSASLEEQVLALGRAYVEFAVANPTTYQLMFGSVIEDFSEYEMLANAADESYALVLSVLNEVCRARPELQMDATSLGGIVWSGVHGLASLRHFQMSRADVKDDRPTTQSLRSLAENTDRALKTLMSGFLP